MRKPYAYSNDNTIEEKKYLQLKVTDIIDRDTAFGALAWGDLTDHHLFKGNDTMMVLERFYWEGCNLEELSVSRANELADSGITDEQLATMTSAELSQWLDDNDINQDVYLQLFALNITILRYLEENGYSLEKLDEYDGVLLNITW